MNKIRLLFGCILLILIFLVPVSGYAMGGDIDVLGSLHRGLVLFPLKSEFILQEGEIKVNQSVNKNIDGRILQIRLLKSANGISYYHAMIIGDSFSYYINVDEKSRKILFFSYNVLIYDALIGSDYSSTYKQALQDIESFYGIPMQQGSTVYQGKNYDFAKFYEKNKYEYYFGLYKDANNQGPDLRFIARTWFPGNDPNSIDATQQGYAFLGKGQYDKAIEMFTQAIEFDQDNILAYQGKSNAYISKKMYDQAIAEVNRAIEKIPDNATSYCLRANAYLQKGDKVEAKKDYNSYLKHAKPDDPLRSSVQQILATL